MLSERHEDGSKKGEKVTGLHQDGFLLGSDRSFTPTLFGSQDLLLPCLTEQPWAPNYLWTCASHAVIELHSTQNMYNGSFKTQGLENIL